MASGWVEQNGTHCDPARPAGAEPRVPRKAAPLYPLRTTGVAGIVLVVAVCALTIASMSSGGDARTQAVRGDTDDNRVMQRAVGLLHEP